MRLAKLARDDRGSVLLLIIGMTALSLAVIIGVLAASCLYLERKRLFTIADGAALAAAQGFDISLPPTASAPRPRLSNASITAATRIYLGRANAIAHNPAQLISAATPDERTAVVTLQSIWRPPVVSMFLPAGMAITVSASARAMD